MTERYTILEYLERTRRRFGERTAVEDDRSSLTYSELVTTAKRAGTAIARRVPSGRPVPVLMEKSSRMLAVMLGAAYAGCFYVPVSPDNPPGRLEKILRVLDSPLVVTEEETAGMCRDAGFGERALDAGKLTECEADEDLLAGIRTGMKETDILYALFTSGSTGVPKAVAVSHGAVVRFIGHFTELFGITEQDCIGNQAPFDFDVSVKDIYSGILTGARISLIPKTYFATPPRLLDYLCGRRVTVLIWAVSALTLVSALKGLDYRVPKDVRMVMFSGEAMPPGQLRLWQAALPEAEFINLYGPTEVTCNCTYYRVGRVFSDGEKIPAGRAFPGRTVFLMDEDGHEIAQPGRTGEICAAGESLASGYYRDREQTEKKFIRFPVHGGGMQRVYRTGDLGYYDASGELVFAGRKDFQIKHMGHRIELEEVESAMNAVPGVTKSCCVFDRKQNRICGFYMGNVTGSQVRRYMKERVPVYMVPSGIRQVAAMPLTKNGKTDREYFLRLAVQARQENDRGKEKI